jgi:hypothetical protein
MRSPNLIKGAVKMSDNNSASIRQVISDFRKWGGMNYRIEKNAPEEGEKYNELKKADADKNGAISFPEYLEYLQGIQPKLKIDRVDVNIARAIEALMNSALRAPSDEVDDLVKLWGESETPVIEAVSVKSSSECATAQKLGDGVVNQSRLVQSLVSELDKKKVELATYQLTSAAALTAKILAEGAYVAADTVTIATGNSEGAILLRYLARKLDEAKSALEKAAADVDKVKNEVSSVETSLANARATLNDRVSEYDIHVVSCKICLQNP